MLYVVLQFYRYSLYARCCSVVSAHFVVQSDVYVERRKLYRSVLVFIYLALHR